MDRISIEVCDNGFDDNGLQHVFRLESWQEVASSDEISQNDAEDAQLTLCGAITTGRFEEESTEVANSETKFYRAVPLGDEGGTVSSTVLSDTVEDINNEDNGPLTPNDQKDSKRREQDYNLEVLACHIIRKERVENVDGRIEVRAGEVEANEAKLRSGGSAKNGGLLMTNLETGMHLSLAYLWVVFSGKMSRRLSLYLTFGMLLFMPSVGVEGALTSIPVNTLVAVGKTARINCSTGMNQSVFWARTLAGSDVEQWLYYGSDGFHSNNVDGRFSMDKDEATGRYDIIIEDVKHKDAGQYVCIDDSGLGARASAELVISDLIKCTTHIPSDGVIGENVFNITQDYIQLSCSLNYTGNLSPNLEWSWPGDSLKSDEQYVSAAKDFVASTLKLSPSKEHNGVTFQCKANIEGRTQYTLDRALQWRSEAVSVKYAAFAQTEVDACPGVEWNLVCNPQCSYSFEERTAQECRCMYTYYDQRTQQTYKIASYDVICEKDIVILQAVFIKVAAVIAVLVSSAITCICCICCIRRVKRRNNSRTV